MTATDVKEPIVTIADAELQTMRDEHGADAFDVWVQETGKTVLHERVLGLISD